MADQMDSGFDVDAMRIVAPDAGELERAAEAALRPKKLSEFVGQRVVRGQLQLVLDAARMRSASPDHVLLAGPPGLGKTTLAMIIAAEMGTSLRLTSGPAIQHAGDLAAILSGLQEGDILFIDEIHRLARTAEEMLYLAMEDVGATTRSGLLPAPLRDRFGFTAHLEFYETDELQSVVTRSASLLGSPIDAQAAHEIASRSRGTPRIANRLLRRVVDYAQVHGDGQLTLEAARGALELFEVDPSGLDRLDRAVLDAICRRFAGGPVGLTTLSVTIGEEAETVETVAEPYLVREGFLVRTNRGRMATPKAWAHLGLNPPAPDGALFD